jgi:tight adherence protein B
MGLITGIIFGLGVMITWGALREPTKFKSRNSYPMNTWFKKKNKYPAELWPDVVDDLSSAIRAGLSLSQALVDLCTSGPEALRPAFQLFRDQYQATGDFNAGLNLVAQHLKDPQGDKFVSSLLIAHEVGGVDLGILLRTLSEVMREELVIRGEIIARQSWTVSGARLAVAAPWVTVLVLSTRDSASAVYTSSSGIRMLAACAVVSVLAYFLMTKMAELPKEKRLLA